MPSSARHIISSVQFNHSDLSDSLWPHGLQHTSLPCPSPNPGACSNSCPSSRWCHPTISSSVSPFSSCPQSFSAPVFSSELALCIRRPKYWNFSFSISSSNEYSGLISFRIDWFDLLAVQGTLIVYHILFRGFLVMPALFDLLSLGCGDVGSVHSQYELFFSAPE